MQEDKEDVTQYLNGGDAFYNHPAQYAAVIHGARATCKLAPCNFKGKACKTQGNDHGSGRTENSGPYMDLICGAIVLRRTGKEHTVYIPVFEKLPC